MWHIVDINVKEKESHNPTIEKIGDAIISLLFAKISRIDTYHT